MSKATITYNEVDISEESGLTSPVAITYNGQTIASVADGESKELQCNGKVMLSDVVVGGKTLKCNGKVMASDVKVGVESESLVGTRWLVNHSLPSGGDTINTLTYTMTISDLTLSPSDVVFHTMRFGYNVSSEASANRFQVTSDTEFYVGSVGPYTVSSFLITSRNVYITITGGSGATSPNVRTLLETYCTEVV